jgi:hypothetical protein
MPEFIDLFLNLPEYLHLTLSMPWDQAMADYSLLSLKESRQRIALSASMVEVLAQQRPEQEGQGILLGRPLRETDLYSAIPAANSSTRARLPTPSPRRSGRQGYPTSVSTI